ncbi:hypothetical protein QQP08_017771 [Theobroma cacao]|nr:hypothetical protein QQP08_017771 [Theobroma cacao]
MALFVLISVTFGIVYRIFWFRLFKNCSTHLWCQYSLHDTYLSSLQAGAFVQLVRNTGIMAPELQVRWLRQGLFHWSCNQMRVPISTSRSLTKHYIWNLPVWRMVGFENLTEKIENVQVLRKLRGKRSLGSTLMNKIV